MDLDIAVLNGMRLEDKPEPGMLLKIVKKGKPTKRNLRMELKPEIKKREPILPPLKLEKREP